MQQVMFPVGASSVADRTSHGVTSLVGAKSLQLSVGTDDSIDCSDSVWRWEAERIVGKGGSSTVYKARVITPVLDEASSSSSSTASPSLPDEDSQVQWRILCPLIGHDYRRGQQQDNLFIAVKEINTLGMSPDEIRAIENEVETMRGLTHKNIVKYGCVHSCMLAQLRDCPDTCARSERRTSSTYC
jgi:hypothetical protein